MKPDFNTLGALKASGYRAKSIKQELRSNLLAALQHKKNVFEGIIGYEHSVIPDLERAILSQHNILLLGLRGQAKTRIARMMVHLLDEYVPYVAGSELYEDPLQPLLHSTRQLLETQGDATPIDWLHRSERYNEKLATPDVSVADLIGDIDPIKAANLRLSYADERVIHYGLIPRSNRSIFVINELPDLQARIQVSLFNILQEGDIQIRGFKVRLPLDIQFVFTANPEDYTNRGNIVTPLKDRIESQILTHYPVSIAVAARITQQEAHTTAQEAQVAVNERLKTAIEQIAFEARDNEYVDAKSGVSARLSISAMENLYSTAERRALLNGETHTQARWSDFWGIVPAITGKIELVYEGEQEGAFLVAQSLINRSLKKTFLSYFPDPELFKKRKKEDPYTSIAAWFGEGNTAELMVDDSHPDYEKKLKSIGGLQTFVQKLHPDTSLHEQYLLMELCLFGMAEFSKINKNIVQGGVQFKDLLDSMINLQKDFNFEE